MGGEAPSRTALPGLTSLGWRPWEAGSLPCGPGDSCPHLVTANLNTAHSDFSPQELLAWELLGMGSAPSLPALCLPPSFSLLHTELLAGLGTLRCDPSQRLWFLPFLSPFLGTLTKCWALRHILSHFSPYGGQHF